MSEHKIGAGQQGSAPGANHKDKHHAHGPKADHPWEVVIDVYLNSVTGGVPDFDIQTCLPTKWDGEPNTNPAVYFFNDGRNGFEIKFRLFDNSGEDYFFIEPEDDAVWSKMGSDCPQRAAYEVFAQKDIQRIDGTTLLVFNPNKGDCVGPFQYTLRVANEDGAPINLDPGGINMNGGSNKSWN